ncbi:hypothetical protein AW097_17615 [Escherichia coli]|nr:hypothetical protein AW078_21105 [Escherichia coli]OTC84853.1 hypothetical protein AW086_22825 [Escherichia coli]OTD36117.1 hypothetical protein AW097_17615 [Escherichia coli]OTD71220.1 hypothetical protein AW103_23030 [Escherichia coli]
MLLLKKDGKKPPPEAGGGWGDRKSGEKCLSGSPVCTLIPAIRKRKLTAVCSHQTRIGNLDAHLI